MRVRDLLREASKTIPQRHAEVLLARTMKQNRAWLLAHSDEDVSPDNSHSFQQLAERRSGGEPLQYILGEQEFFGLTLQVGPGVLIPRPETEHLIEAVLDWSARVSGPLRVVDVGTGSGAIALALARHLPQAEIIATDISTDALEIAARNASALGLASRVMFRHSDLLSKLSLHGLDAVVSNPPYVPTADASGMQREVVEHEPHEALFAGEGRLRRLSAADTSSAIRASSRRFTCHGIRVRTKATTAIPLSRVE